MTPDSIISPLRQFTDSMEAFFLIQLIWLLSWQALVGLTKGIGFWTRRQKMRVIHDS